ncbi:mucin-6-like [Mustelus asterias]
MATLVPSSTALKEAGAFTSGGKAAEQPRPPPCPLDPLDSSSSEGDFSDPTIDKMSQLSPTPGTRADTHTSQDDGQEHTAKQSVHSSSTLEERDVLASFHSPKQHSLIYHAEDGGQRHYFVPRSLQETLTVKNHMFCSTWGTGAFRPFDDKFYHFTSTCNYILSRHCTSGGEDFNIQIRRGSNGNLERIYIKIEGIKILVVNGTISVQDEGSYGSIHDYIRLYAVLGTIFTQHLSYRVTVPFDDKLILDSSYQGQLCGLCGNVEEGSNTIYGPSFFDANKLDVLGHTCHNKLHQSKYAESTTCVVGISNYFTSCFENNNLIEQYLKMCIADSYTCKESKCECATFEEMSRQCHKETVTQTREWRTDLKCKKPECPATQVYKECGPACVPTCSAPKSQPQCDQCVNTCDCPEGTVLDDIRGRNTCIKKAECPCEYDGAVYSSGDTRTESCQSCTCEAGTWSCSHRKCPGRCKIEEATYITTFDSNYYSMKGDCSYVAVFTEHWTIKVAIHQCQAAFKQTCLQSVTLTKDQTSFVFNNDGKVHFDGTVVTMPFRKGGVIIFQQSSMFIQVATTFGLKMQVQISPIMQLYISLSEDFKKSTKGLCGVFNDNADDDFLSRDGIVESTPITFVNSWKIQKSCPDAIVPPACVSSENEKYASDKCKSIKDPSGAFSVCHSAVDPIVYYQMCVAATCACEDINDCLCAGLGAYVHECAAHGITVKNWRGNICNTPCANTQVFENDMKTCNRTCRSLSEYDYTCMVQDVPVYGCGCPEGKYMDNAGACIDTSDCPCYIGEVVIKEGQSVTVNGQICACENGKPYCSIAPTTARPGCLNGKTYFDCRNMDTYCAKTCKNYNKPCSASRCVPGCVCPANLVEDDNGRCIAPEQCPCSYGGENYAPGITIAKDCNNCTCKSGTWECTKKLCAKECLVYGDGHYVSFDGKRYRYDGNCEYILVEDRCNQGSGTIQILIESVPCCENGVTCSRNIRILFEDTEFKLTDGRVIRAVMPQSQSKCPDDPYSLHTVGLYLIIKFSNGITVIWDKRTRVSITLDPRWKNKICGLCGNFNGDVSDDLTTKGKSLVTNTLEFGNSWKSTLSCSNVINQTFPCDRNPYCLAWAQRKCGIIKETVFQKCHKKVDPTPFYEACIQEACACDLEGKYLGFCTAVAVYAEACNKAGVCIRWRTPDLCPVYCDYYNQPDECSWHYHPCGKLTTKTCSDHYVGKKYSAILEGCYAKCPEGAPYLDENIMKCVKLTDCTCYYNGKILQPGETIRTPCKDCSCQGGNVTCTPITTTPTTPTTVSTPATTTTVIRTTTKSTTGSTPEATTTPKGTTTAAVEGTTTTRGITTTVKSSTIESTTSSTPEVTTKPVIPTTSSSTTSLTPGITTTVKPTTTPPTTSPTSEEITTPKATSRAVITETTTKKGATSTLKSTTTRSTTAPTSERITATVKPTTTQSTIGSTPGGITTTVKSSTMESTTSSTPEVTTKPVIPTTTSSTTSPTPGITTTVKPTTTPPTTSPTSEEITTPKATSRAVISETTTKKGATSTLKSTTTRSTTAPTSERITATVKPTTTQSTIGSTPEVTTSAGAKTTSVHIVIHTESTVTPQPQRISTPEMISTTVKPTTTSSNTSPTPEVTTTTKGTTTVPPVTSTTVPTTTQETTTTSVETATTEVTTKPVIPTTTSSTPSPTPEVTSKPVKPTTTSSTTSPTPEVTTATKGTTTVPPVTSTTVPTTTTQETTTTSVETATTEVTSKPVIPTTTSSTPSPTPEVTSKPVKPTTTSSTTSPTPGE